MKYTSDGVSVYSRLYYYLLDYNEYDNWQTINSKFGKTKLNELTYAEFQILFEIATKKDLELLNTK